MRRKKDIEEIGHGLEVEMISSDLVVFSGYSEEVGTGK